MLYVMNWYGNVLMSTPQALQNLFGFLRPALDRVRDEADDSPPPSPFYFLRTPPQRR